MSADAARGARERPSQPDEELAPCIVCGKPRTIPERVVKPGSTSRKQAPGSYVDRSVYEADPYCSTECCKADHGLLERPVGSRTGQVGT